MKTFATLGIVMLVLLAAACDYLPSEDRVATSHAQDVEDWKERRLASLLQEDGWLSLIGLEWIDKGSHRIGSSARNEVVVRSDSVPEWVGVIVVDRMPGVDGDEQVHARARFVTNPGAEVVHEGKPVVDTIDLHTDFEENTTYLEVGTVQFHLIERGERLAVRIKDSQAPTRLDFQGLDYYPFAPSWRIEGRFLPHEKVLRIGDVTGSIQEERSPGAIHFVHDGRNLSLDVLEGGPGRYFVIFADETNGLETYGAGRYLYTDAEDEEERIVIDFNQSYNPPCVFTDFATCPLPPRQNRLPVEVRAGERMYAGGHHWDEPSTDAESADQPSTHE